MKKNEQKHHENYIRKGSEQIVEAFKSHVEDVAKQLGKNLTPAALADIMNDTAMELHILDTVFKEDIGKLELLIDIYESFDLEFPWDEGYTVDDFFINYTNVGYVDIGSDVAECLGINGKPVDGNKEEWFTRIVHRQFQPCRYREISIGKVMLQFIGLYRTLQVVHCEGRKIIIPNPYK